MGTWRYLVNKIKVNNYLNQFWEEEEEEQEQEEEEEEEEKEVEEEEEEIWVYLCHCSSVFYSFIVYRNTHRPCYVFKRAYRCHVQEFWAVTFVKANGCVGAIPT